MSVVCARTTDVIECVRECGNQGRPCESQERSGRLVRCCRCRAVLDRGGGKIARRSRGEVGLRDGVDAWAGRVECQMEKSQKDSDLRLWAKMAAKKEPPKALSNVRELVLIAPQAQLLATPLSMNCLFLPMVFWFRGLRG